MHEIIDFLNIVGCPINLLNEATFDKGIVSKDIRSIVCWLSRELRTLLSLDEQVHLGSDDTEFSLELSSLLRELGCPYSVLVTGSTSQRFQSKTDCILLLNYLISELMAAKMSHKLNPKDKIIIEILESPPAVALKSITQNLNLGKPPQTITPTAFFEKVLNQISELYKKNENIWGKALYVPSKALSFEDWQKLEKLQSDLQCEYDLRRDMLITRLDVTIQSFQWSDSAEKKTNIIAECYLNKRQILDKILRSAKATDIVELLAARNDILCIQKTSSAQVRRNTQSDVQKFIIGMVPDRGGRANEHQPPPPEMPAWQKNRNQDGQGGKGRGFNYKGQNPQQQRNYQKQQYMNAGNYSGNNTQNQQFKSSDEFHRNSRGGSNRVQGGWSQSGGNRSNENYRNFGHNQEPQENSGERVNRNYDGGPNRSYGGGQSNYSRRGRR